VKRERKLEKCFHHRRRKYSREDYGEKAATSFSGFSTRHMGSFGAFIAHSLAHLKPPAYCKIGVVHFCPRKCNIFNPHKRFLSDLLGSFAGPGTPALKTRPRSIPRSQSIVFTCNAVESQSPSALEPLCVKNLRYLATAVAILCAKDRARTACSRTQEPSRVRRSAFSCVPNHGT
jgi:hypothetical protein